MEQKKEKIFLLIHLTIPTEDGVDSRYEDREIAG